jgi:hypothetical protein
MREAYNPLVGVCKRFIAAFSAHLGARSVIMAVTADELRQVLATSAFAQIYNFGLHSFASGQCTLELPFQEAIERCLSI